MAVIAIDTNILLRHLLDDDPGQKALVRSLLERDCSPEDPALVPFVVLCETVWVLGRSYRYTKMQLIRTLERVAETRVFQVESEPLFLSGLADFRTSKAGFVDCLIGRLAENAGASPVWTFDQRAAQLPAYSLLQ